MKARWRKIFFLGFFAISCGKREHQHFEFMPDMHRQPSLKAQEAGAMRMPPAGTVPRNFRPVTLPTTVLEASNVQNPLPRSKAVLQRGEKVYKNYCLVCHGPYGEGNGTIVPKFPQPPTLQSDKIKGYTDGNLFFVMTKGQNIMPSYASQVPESDRWAVAHYIRVLHRAKSPTPADIKAFERSLE